MTLTNKRNSLVFSVISIIAIAIGIILLPVVNTLACDGEPIEDEFSITISKMEAVGNEFGEIEVYTSGNAYDLIVLQNKKAFNYYVKDSHHLILTVGDLDTFAKARIYDPVHEDKFVEVKRLSSVDEFSITISKMEVVGNEFDEIEVYTSGNAYDLIVLQNKKAFNYYVKDSHHLILTVGDLDTFAKVRIYDPAHEDKFVEIRRLSPVDPMA